ncbi:endonuclease III [Candidatus Bathyarchaeota archaeon]|nr:endonuclease III [Candidatus Bathyarchaeota archaeon]
MSSRKNELKSRVLEIINLLEKVHPDAKLALKWSNPLELLIATVLSAQTTDERVNRVTESLFKRYRTAEDYANTDLEELEHHIKSLTFYRAKAKNIKEACRIIVEEYNGEVPRTMKNLLRLPGVARKTANVVLSNAYGIMEGMIVDTHVKRLSQKLGLTEEEDPEKIERDLIEIVPKDKWLRFADLLIFHGRRICTAKDPKCGECVLNKICPSSLI